MVKTKKSAAHTVYFLRETMLTGFRGPYGTACSFFSGGKVVARKTTAVNEIGGEKK